MLRRRLCMSALVLCAASACSPPSEASVDGVLLAQAWGVYEPEPAPLVKLTADGEIPALPSDSEVVRVAIARSVPWHRVDELLERIDAAHKRAVILIGKRHRLKAFPLSDEISGASIALTATMDGKACVSPPGVAEAKCVQTSDKMHIEAAWTRELVREAMLGYQLTRVNVEVPKALRWDDVVRTIDAARTCCGDVKMRVFLNR